MELCGFRQVVVGLLIALARKFPGESGKYTHVFRGPQICFDIWPLLTLEKGRFIDVGLVGENHHKISLIVGEDPLLNEGVVPFLCITSYTSLSR
jgi:hypothetical protein